MSEKIKEIPTEELQKDLEEANEDKNNCEFAMNLGIYIYKSKDGSIQDVGTRYRENLRQISLIKEELVRRMVEKKP